MARDPNNLIKPHIEQDSIKVLKIENLPDFDIEDYDLYDDKSRDKYFKDIERDVRNSIEYRAMVNYLRVNMGMDRCSFYENVSNLNSPKIKIHIHHDPFTLYDITRTVFNKRCELGEPLEIELVSREIMILHYQLLVGLIPLAETVHELVHNNYLFVPCDKVMGRYMDFYNAYNKWIEPETKDTFDRILEATKACGSIVDTSLLEKRYIYIDAGEQYRLPELQTIASILNERIESIRSSQFKPADKDTPKPELQICFDEIPQEELDNYLQSLTDN